MTDKERRKTITSTMGSAQSDATTTTSTQVKTKAISSVKHKGMHYFFEHKLGSGV